jgi:hypothetical protein
VTLVNTSIEVRVRHGNGLYTTPAVELCCGLGLQHIHAIPEDVASTCRGSQSQNGKRCLGCVCGAGRQCCAQGACNLQGALLFTGLWANCIDAPLNSSPAKGTTTAGRCIAVHIAFFPVLSHGWHARSAQIGTATIRPRFRHEAWLYYEIFSSDPGRQITQHLL